MKHHKKTIFLISLLAGAMVFFSRCVNEAAAVTDPRGKLYAGAEACRQCHASIYDSFAYNAHARATSKPLSQNIRGNFDTGNHMFNYDKNTRLVMEKRGSEYYQVLYQNGKENGAYKLDVLFGFRNAQTSGYWSNDKLFELPLSHYQSANAWGTSPGFPADFVKLGRLINTDCLDCHSSGINIRAGASIGSDQLYDRSSLVYGIDCERCHGPAANHVNYHIANPGLHAAAYLVKNSDLTRQQKLDACAVCHSGNDKPKIQSRFVFKMGDTLSYFFLPKFGGQHAEIDVHGNQYSLLQQSACYRNAANMTCGTCHDPHKDDRQELTVYSQKCMSCHNLETHNFCPKFASLGESIKANCIDCHMPKLPSKAIRFQLQNDNVFSGYLLHTHNIAVYPDSFHLKQQTVTGK